MIGDWAVHIFREHNKEADLWVGFGTKGTSMEWKDESATDWTKATGIWGFWDGSCDDKVCGAGITISIFLQGVGWVMRFKNADQWKVPPLWMLNLEVVPCRLKVSKFGCKNTESRVEVVLYRISSCVCERCHLLVQSMQISLDSPSMGKPSVTGLHTLVLFGGYLAARIGQGSVC